jgi:hypothetical protein
MGDFAFHINEKHLLRPGIRREEREPLESLLLVMPA